MKSSILWRVAAIAALTVALGSQGVAQDTPQASFGGLLHHYTPALDAGGPWHISGQWSLWVKGNTGRANFSAAVSMVRSDNTTDRQPHTHHIAIVDGEVSATATGFQVSGIATITGNGSPAPFSPSPLTVQITGGSLVQNSNIGLAFGGAAVNHYGADPVRGVVTEQR